MASKKIKTTVGQIIDSVPAINQLITQSMTIDTSFKINAISGVLEPTIKAFNDANTAYITKNGSKDEENGGFVIHRENKDVWEEYLSQIKVMREKPVEVSIDKLTMHELKANQVKMSPDHLTQLKWVII